MILFWKQIVVVTLGNHFHYFPVAKNFGFVLCKKPRQWNTQLLIFLVKNCHDAGSGPLCT